jgi:hypothetical protein
MLQLKRPGMKFGSELWALIKGQKQRLETSQIKFL